MRGIQYYNRCKQYGDVGVWMHPIFYRLLQENLGGSIMTRVKAIYVTAVALSLTLPIFSKPTVSEPNRGTSDDSRLQRRAGERRTSYVD